TVLPESWPDHRASQWQIREWPQFHAAEEDLRTLALEQDPSPVRFQIEGLVDQRPVHADLKPVSARLAVDEVPLAGRFLDVIGPAKIPDVLPRGRLGQPVDAAPALDGARPAIRLPLEPAVGIALIRHEGGHPRSDESPIGRRAADQEDIAGGALKEVALDGRHEGAVAVVTVAVRAGRMEEDP